MIRLTGEQFEHPPGAGADIDQPLDPGIAEYRGHRRFDLLLGDMKRADCIPLAGIALEPARRVRGAIGADRRQPGRIGFGASMPTATSHG